MGQLERWIELQFERAKSSLVQWAKSSSFQYNLAKSSSKPCSSFLLEQLQLVEFPSLLAASYGTAPASSSYSSTSLITNHRW